MVPWLKPAAAKACVETGPWPPEEGDQLSALFRGLCRAPEEGAIHSTKRGGLDTLTRARHRKKQKGRSRGGAVIAVM